MPLRKQVNTLKQICIKRIMKNLSDYEKEDVHQLPVDLMEELNQEAETEFIIKNLNYLHMESMEELKQFEANGVTMNQLVKANVKKISVSFPGFKFHDDSAMFSKLTSLTCWCSGDTQQDILRLLRLIPNVVVLTLHNSRHFVVNDDIFEAIGDHCPQLESLSFDYECPITDNGIDRFLKSKSGGSKIKYLQLDSESEALTVKGCLLALTNLKQLKVLHCYFLEDALTELFDHFILKGSPTPTFQLVEIPHMSPKRAKVEKGFLRFLSKCCPNVTNLSLSICENVSGSMDELRNCNFISFGFFFGQLQLVKSDLFDIGSKVTELQMRFTSFDLETIKLCFPNLRKLLLIKVDLKPLNLSVRKNLPIAFTKLQHLEMFCPISLAHLKYLFENCLQLEELSLSSNDKLTDDEMFSILNEVNPLRCLKSFSISGCNGISKRSILELLRRDNDLNKLSIFDCSMFTESDVSEIKCHIRENNYSVRLITKDNFLMSLYSDCTV